MAWDHAKSPNADLTQHLMQHSPPMLCSVVLPLLPGLFLLMRRLAGSLRKPNMSAEINDIASIAYPRNKHIKTPGQGCCCAAVEVWEAVMALSFQLRSLPASTPTQLQQQGQQQPWHTTLHVVQAAPLLVEALTISNSAPPVDLLLLLSQSCSLLRSKLFQDLQGSRPYIPTSLEEAASATDDQQVQSAQLGRVERVTNTCSMADQQQRQKQRRSMVSLQQQQQEQQQQGPQGECQQWEAQVQSALRGPWYLESLWDSVHMKDQPLLASLVDCILDFFVHDDLQQLPSQLQSIAAKEDANNTSCNNSSTSSSRSSSRSSRNNSSSQECCEGYKEDNSSGSSRDGTNANRFSGMGDGPEGDLSSSSSKPLRPPLNSTWRSSHQEVQSAPASAVTLGTPSLPPPGAAGAALSVPSCIPSKQCKQTEGCVAAGVAFPASSTAAAAGVGRSLEENAKKGPPSAGTSPGSAHKEAACKQFLEVAAQLGTPWLLLQLAGAEGGTAQVGPPEGSSAVSASASLRVVLDVLMFLWGPEGAAAKCSSSDKSAVCADTPLRLTMLLLVLLQKCSVDSRVELLQATPYGTELLSVCYELLRLPQVSTYSRQVDEPWRLSQCYDVPSNPGCIVRPGPLGAASMADGGKGLDLSITGLPSGGGLGSAETRCSLVLLFLQHLLLEPAPGLVIGPEHIKQGAVLATGRGENMCLWLGRVWVLMPCLKSRGRSHSLIILVQN